MDTLKKEINYLKDTKRMVLKNLNDIENAIVNKNIEIMCFCKNSKEGHEFETQIEEGIYGMTWNVCIKCGYEK